MLMPEFLFTLKKKFGNSFDYNRIDWMVGSSWLRYFLNQNYSEVEMILEELESKWHGNGEVFSKIRGKYILY